MASGEMSQSEFTAFLTSVFTNLAEFSVDGSIHFQCMDWRHVDEILQAGRKAYHELKGTSPHINNVELGKHGRYRTNI